MARKYRWFSERTFGEAFQAWKMWREITDMFIEQDMNNFEKLIVERYADYSGSENIRSQMDISDCFGPDGDISLKEYEKYVKNTILPAVVVELQDMGKTREDGIRYFEESEERKADIEKRFSQEFGMDVPPEIATKTRVYAYLVGLRPLMGVYKIAVEYDYPKEKDDKRKRPMAY